MEHTKLFVSFLVFLCLITTCAPSPNPGGRKNHFVFVHGAGHGAWCWYKVQQVRTNSDYVKPLIQFMESLPPKERLILVAHSVGGVAISIAMERFPEKIALAVFATAEMPGPALSYLTISNNISSTLDAMDSQYRLDQGPEQPATSILFGPKFLSSSMYQLSPPEDLTLAISLVRFYPLIYEEIKLTNERYGSVRKVFIWCEQDQTITEDVRRMMVSKNPPDEVKVINGSDHMVMLSKPLELFSYLHDVAV